MSPAATTSVLVTSARGPDRGCGSGKVVRTLKANVNYTTISNWLLLDSKKRGNLRRVRGATAGHGPDPSQVIRRDERAHPFLALREMF